MSDFSKKQLTIALIINPYAGIGGSLAFKGSDGMIDQAMALGAELKAGKRVVQALEAHVNDFQQLQWFAVPGDMGGNVLTQLGIEWQPLDHQPEVPSTAQDTTEAANLALQKPVDLILFAGGDGTARDICKVVQDSVPVLGIPAGVKIHSSVYAVTPHAAGEVLCLIQKGGLVDLRNQEVRDIDEQAFRQNQVKSKHFGEMSVPDQGEFIQHTKTGGIEDERLVIHDISEFIIEQMEPDEIYLVGSGKTTAMIMENLSLPNTLLGIDAIKNRELIQADLAERDILKLIETSTKVNAVISVIGGQGHILGRGNQQFSPEVIRLLGKKNFQVISTKGKIKNLEGRPLMLDTGDRKLDQQLSGLWTIITGYDDQVIYPAATC